MNRVTWLVECFDENKEAFHKAVTDAGHDLRIAQPFEYTFCGDFVSELTDKSPVVFYGSIGFGKSVKRSELLPGAYYDSKQFNCSRYYAVFNEDLLNSRYIMLPWYALSIPENKEMIFDLFGNNNCVFIRPDSGDKTFTGSVFTRENWDEEIRRAGFYDPESHDMCLISEPRNIAAEFRFVVVNGRVIAGSRYKLGGKLDCSGVTDKCSSWKYAQEVVDKAVKNGKQWEKAWEMPPCWVIDTCLLSSGPADKRVVEIGCFSCAGLYSCNLDDVVREVSKAAYEEWNSYQC